MCGIAGTMGAVEFSLSEKMEVFESLSKRGPDGTGIERIQLGAESSLNFFFSRLSILDLADRAMQPMSFNKLTILMNGEIYNFRELAQVIEERRGPQDWLTTGDTEVALKYLAFFGIEAIKDFDGMFAIALWNDESQELTLARDYFGEKPLHYTVRDDTVLFASEPKSLFLMNTEKPVLNRDKVLNFVVNGYKYLYKDDKEFFDDVSVVMPGEAIVFKSNAVTKPKRFFYKSIPHEKPNRSESRSSAIDRIKKSVIKSVGLRLESDVPISISLSGGIDSGLIAAIAKKDFGVSLHAFTLESSDIRYSESTIARRVAEFIGIGHTVVDIESLNFLERMREIVSYHDSPISTISYYVQNLLMRKIHEAGFKVSLMGSGADEMFSGYYDHHLLFLAEMFQRDRHHYYRALEEWTTHVLPLVRNPIFRSPNLYIESPQYRNHIFDGAEHNRLLIKDGHPVEFFERKFSQRIMRNRMMNELFYEVIPVILKEDDRNSMMYSVENRSPYLSYDILTESLKTDLRHFIHEGRTKSLLREAFRGYLPDDVLYSYKKVGFNANFTEICDINSEEFQEFLNDGSKYWEIINREKAKEILNSVTKEDYLNKTAFNLVSAKVFVDKFSET